MKFKVALVQMAVTSEKSENLQTADKLIKQSVENGAQIVILPECFNSPYNTSCFPKYAEVIPGKTSAFLSKAAKENNIFLIGGSFPEKENGKIYNTCLVFNPKGEIIAKHRKVHLVDINVPGRIRFREADTLSPGNDLTAFDTPFCKIGVGVCFDLRFPELAHLYGEMGCKLLVYPGAFNMTTGPSHVDPLLRARAIDNEVYTMLVSVARDEEASYVAWGHSSVVSPWGDVLATCDHQQTIVYCDIDPDYVDQKATSLITQAAHNGAQLVILPECFNSPYSTACFPKYAETIPGETTDILSQAAKDNNIFLIGGSIPEQDHGQIYNTCPVFNPKGELIAKHRKVHLVDLEIPGKLRFREADTLSPGNEFTTFDTPFCKIGVGICLDLRIPEFAHVYGEIGCEMLIYPGSFSVFTGPSHLEPLLRARAIDNQLFVAFVSAARDENASYVAWGHSSVVNPWGDVIGTTEHQETILYCNINLDSVKDVRNQLRLRKRHDVYSGSVKIQSGGN